MTTQLNAWTSRCVPTLTKRAWRTCAALGLVAGLLSGGCISKPALREQLFAFQQPGTAPSAVRGSDIVAIGPASVSPLFNQRSFTYRIGPEAYETDAYASFLVPPGQAIAIAVRGHLLSSGRFRDVIETGSRTKPDKMVEVSVTELYADFSRPAQWTAVLSMRISMFDGDAAKGRQPLVQKISSRTIPLRERTAVAAMAAWDKALGEIVGEFSADLAGADRRE